MDSGSTDAGLGSGCTDNAACPQRQYCAASACGFEGTCAAVPAASSCSGVLSPVCGCDGLTYTNACGATAAGVNVASMGPCTGGADAGDAGIASGDGGMAEDAGRGRGRDGGRERPDAGKAPPDAGQADAGGGTIDAGRRGRVTCGDVTCDGNESCCDATQSCFQTTCTNCCDSTATACTANGDCATGQYCAGAGCGTAGLCEGLPTRCSRRMEPVCGCDGTSYANECAAQEAGTRVAMSGMCSLPPPDAGTLDAGAVDAGHSDAGVTCTSDIDCASTQYCQAARCGAVGACQARPDPTTCTAFQPVCGCDGQTYGSPCSAQANGVNVASMSACGTDAGTDAGP